MRQVRHRDRAAAHATSADGPSGAASTAPAAVEPTSAGARLRHLLFRRHPSWVHLLIVLLCVAVGFALAVQVRQTQEDTYATMRQDDLIRLLDELSVRNRELTEEGVELRRELSELESGSSSRAAAQEAAEQQARVQGILAGALPVVGPGIELVVHDPSAQVSAPTFVTVLEELRNAGAEVVELNGVRLVTSTWFRDEGGAIVVDDEPLESPYEWTVIGDPQTMDRALEIPGGALATVRTAGAEASTTAHDRVEITAVREPDEPEFATPQEPAE